YVLMPTSLASLVANAVGYFCSTTSQSPATRPSQAPSSSQPGAIETLQKKLSPAAEPRRSASIDATHQAGIGHDITLKRCALSEPNIPADYVLFDEAQDADPLMLGILLKQRSTRVIYVGDAHQQIYAWRGAVNAMQQLP